MDGCQNFSSQNVMDFNAKICEYKKNRLRDRTARLTKFFWVAVPLNVVKVNVNLPLKSSLN